MSLRTWRRPARNDLSAIIGMQTPGAGLLATGLWVAYVLLGLTGGGITSPALYVSAMVLLCVAGALVLLAPGDRMDWRATAVAAVLPAVALLIGSTGTGERPGVADATLTGGVVTVLAFLLLRGRLASAWAGFLLSVVVTVLAAQIGGPDPAMVAAVMPNTAVLLLATFFEVMVRPRAEQIHALRRRTEVQAVAQAAAQGAMEVRERQLAYLDERARPLLEQIAAGDELAPRTLTECGLVEAALRDRIRAPGLEPLDLGADVWAARARGARVVLLDDRRSPDDDVTELLRPLQAAAVTALGRAGVGTAVTVRLLPPGRPLLATLSVVGDNSQSRQDFGLDGAARTEADRAADRDRVGRPEA
ncbi:hypothetical protein ACFQNE_06010 [Gordonia phosphorivorans]|uniref:Uncharacterized protein n=1 Tax=Gordonia phosphorivorans TaxID=1056982 RepID=A0ABV6H5T0_9ACTN